MNSVAMPQLGESVDEGTVVRWLKNVGDAIVVDEPLFEVASDKVNMEIPSLNAGILSEILVPAGATVPVGTMLAHIASDAGEATANAKATAPAAPAHSATTTPAAPASAAPSNSKAATNGAHRHAHSPAVRRLAREHALDLALVPGNGAKGRVTRADVLAYIASPSNGAASPERYDTQPSVLAIAALPATAPPPVPATASAPKAPSVPLKGGRPVPFSPIRARIAENVLASKRAVADVFSVMEVDMENVHAARIAQRDAFKSREGLSLTYLPFITRATIEALRAFPAVNARIDGSTLVYNDAVHLGMAVDLDEKGLVVPVIRNADGLNITGIARAIGSLSSAARNGTLAPDGYGGSTFTITNNGAFGTLMTAPIINQPNVAILSTDAIEERVVPHNGMVAIRRRMYLCMSWDHRAFDGSTAAKFLASIKRDLEDRDWRGQS